MIARSNSSMRNSHDQARSQPKNKGGVLNKMRWFRFFFEFSISGNQLRLHARTCFRNANIRCHSVSQCHSLITIADHNNLSGILSPSHQEIGANTCQARDYGYASDDIVRTMPIADAIAQASDNIVSTKPMQMRLCNDNTTY